MPTFQHVPGRLWVILYPPEEFVSLTAEAAAQRVYQAMEQIGLPLRNKVQ